MLRLTKIDLNGFKSFALPTAVETDYDILGIVGPNGAGKSNVLDAIYFVFGEQKPTVLRVGRLSDIIFGGTKTHPAQNLARVSLTFEYLGDDEGAGAGDIEPELIHLPEDDEAGDYASLPFGSELGEAGEGDAGDAGGEGASEGVAEPDPYGLARLQPGDVITLSRKAYREGLSDYQINGKAARLSTIDRTFARFQLGRFAAYSINQGEVEKKLLSSPQEIREWLGEASGVALLLRAKTTIARRLERTQRNLTRVRDIISTLDEDVAALHDQAQDALRHEYLGELRRWLAGKLIRGRLLSTAAKYEKVAAERASHAERTAKLEELIAARRLELEQAERDAAEALRQNRELVDELARLREEHSRLRISDSVMQEKGRSLAQRMQEEAARLTSSRQRLEEIGKMRAGLDERVAGSAKLLEEADGMLRKAEELVLREENSLAWLRDEMNAAGKRRSDAEREFAVTKEKLANAQRDRQICERRIKEIEQDRQARAEELSKLQSSRDQLSLDFVAKEERLTSEQRRLEEMRVQFTKLSDDLRVSERELASVNERASYLAAMKNTYEALKADFYATGDSASALQLTPLLDLISFEDEWSEAVELALGEVAKAFVIADGNGEQIVGEPSLHGIFIAPQQLATETVQKPWESLWGFLHGERRVISALRTALGEIAVVNTAAEAQSLLAEHIGLSGCLIRPALTLLTRGVIRKPGAPEATLLFHKHAELPRVDEEIVALAEKRVVIEERVRSLDEQRNRFASEITHWDKAVRNLQVMSVDLRSKLTEAESREKGVSGEREKLAAQHKALAAQLTELTALEQSLQTKHETLAAELSKMGGETERQAANLKTSEERLVQHREKIRELEKGRLRIASEREVVDAECARLARETSALEAECARNEAARADMENEHATLTREQKANADALKALAEKLAASEGDASGFTTRQTELAAWREQLNSELQSLLESQQRLAASSTDQNERLWQAESELAEVFREVHGSLGISVITMMHELERDIVRPQVQPSEFHPSFGAVKAVEAVDAPVREMAPMLDYRTLSEKDCREELSRVERALANLGEVNPLAPREYAEKHQRLTFLQRQEEDLQLAAADTQSALERLEAQTKERFAASLKHIEAKFNELFVQLFGGGFARFRLTEPDNLTASGVEIEVQLPNGRRQNLKSLSGGERSLLFIALFIAVHMVRPGSFCVLDEVDAALDDVNVVRLLRLLQDLSQQEQFIVITHNKHTMKVMQRLVGVVTQPRGVSRVLEVTLKQAEGYVEGGAQ